MESQKFERESLRVHSFLEKFPTMEPAELQELSNDILENGLKDTITLSADGTTIIDGRARLTACGIVGVEPRFNKISQNKTEEEIIRFIIEQNIKTRKFGVGQRAIIGAKYMELVPEYQRPVEPDGQDKDKHRNFVGRFVGTSGKSVQYARIVIQFRPDLEQLVWSGEITLNQAYERTMMSRGKRVNAPSRSTKRIVVPFSDNPPAGNDKTKIATDARVKWLKHYAEEEGLDSFAIAKRLGITDGVVRRIARRHEIEIAADAWTLKRKKGNFDINRVAQVVADDLVAMSTAVSRLIENNEELDPRQTKEWARIYWRTARQLNKLAKRIYYMDTRIDSNHDNDNS